MPTQTTAIRVDPACDSSTHSCEPALRAIFIALFLQLAAIVILALELQVPPSFIVRGPIAAWDYHAYYMAAENWLRGDNPYKHVRFVTPPSSLLAGAAFNRLGYTRSRYVFFACNFSLILGALVLLSRRVGLGRRQIILILGITLLYYPFYSIVERGNVDGIMLALLAFACLARTRIARAALMAASIALKLYSALVLVVYARRRLWALTGLILAFVVLSQLPFFRWEGAFFHTLVARAGRMRLNENISPAALFWYSGLPWWKPAFLLFWLGTLAYKVIREGEPAEGGAVIEYIPWMVTIPTLVYTYSAVLYLLCLPWLGSQWERRPFNHSDKLFIAGFLCTAVQAVAFTTYFPPLWDFVYLLTPVGSLLIMLSRTFAAVGPATGVANSGRWNAACYMLRKGTDIPRFGRNCETNVSNPMNM